MREGMLKKALGGLIIAVMAIAAACGTPGVDAQAILQDACTGRGITDYDIVRNGTHQPGEGADIVRWVEKLRVSGGDLHILISSPDSSEQGEDIRIGNELWVRHTKPDGTWGEWRHSVLREPSETADTDGKAEEATFCGYHPLSKVKLVGTETVQGEDTRKFEVEFEKFDGDEFGQGKFIRQMTYWINLDGKVVQFQDETIREDNDKLLIIQTFDEVGVPNVITAPDIP